MARKLPRPQDLIAFLKGAYKNPRSVGTLFPLSSWIAQSMFEEIHAYWIQQHSTDKTPLRILEVGAGTGALTYPIARALTLAQIPYTLDAIECEALYCQHLERTLSLFPSITIHCQDILTWHPIKSYTIIISTLPFNSSAFNASTIAHILQLYTAWLGTSGLFLWIEYIGLRPFARFLQRNNPGDFSHKHAIMHDFRQNHSTRRRIIFCNIPPSYLYISTITPH